MPAWIGPTVAISLLIIAFCLMAIVFAILVTLKNLVSQSISLSREFSELRHDLTPTLKYLQRLGQEGSEIADMAKDELREIVSTTRKIRLDLENGVHQTKRRLADFNAVIEVVQEEVEETVLDVGAALRSARTGAGMVGQLRRLLVPKRGSR